jgi:hypothetical protein
MQGTMMHNPLTLSHSLERAGKFFSKTRDCFPSRASASLP